MNTKNYKCLCDIPDKIEEGKIEQELEVTLGEHTVTFIIIRELYEGSNISEVTNCFENNPWLEDNKVKYDDDLSILEVLFDAQYVEFDTGDHIDQILWDMDVNDEKTMEIIYTDNEFNTESYEVTIKLISNTLEIEE